MNGIRSRSLVVATPILVCVALFASVVAFVAQGVTPVTQAAPETLFTVNNVADAVDAVPGDGTCATATGVCTLRAAIQEANSLAGDDTIDLRADTYVLSLAGASEDAGATGDLDITDNLKILGSGETSTIVNGGQIDRVFHVIGNINVTISGVTIRNGLTPAGEDGGGVLADDNSTFTLSDSIVDGNEATHWGGGLHSDVSATTVITDVLIQNNTAGVLGGGVDNYNGVLNISNSRILNNEVTAGPGGGVYNGSGGTTTIEDTTIDGNKVSADGGGVYNFRPDSASSGSLVIRRTTISNNEATLNGGGLYNFGLLSELQNTTMSGNTANDDGGALYNAKTITLINHVTIYNNTSASQGGGIYNDVDSTVTIKNSIIASNSNDNCKPINPITSGGNNIESANNCGLNATGDDINTDPILGSLGDNGGSTYTHKPAANSPAIDQASNVGPPATDQRGTQRPQGDGHDIGAYEHKMADLSITKSDDPDPVYAGETLTYTLTVANAGQSDAITVKLTDTLPTGTTFVSASGTGWGCSNVSQVVLCNKTVLRSGDSSTLTVKVTAPSEGGTITNEASVGSTITDLKTTDNEVSQSTTVTAVANLSLSKNDDVDPVNAAGALEYSLQVDNAGPSTATNLVVTDTLMAGVTYVLAEGAGWSCSYDSGSHIVTCTRASLSVGSAPVITIDVTAPDEDGPVYNVAGVTSDVVDLDRSNNQADEYTSVMAVADLSVTKSDVSDPVYASESITYTLTASNNGPSTAKSTRLTDTLPTGTTFVSASGTGWTCAYDSSIHAVICTQASFVVGPAQTIQVVLNAPIEGATISNRVTIASDALDLSTGNNTTTETTVITPKTDLSVTQSHSPTSVYAEGQLTYNVKVGNAGPSTATSLVMSSTLPSDVTILSASGSGWVCTFNQANHLVTCTRSSLSVADAPEITITIKAPAEGGITTNHAHISAATFDPDTSNDLATEDVTVIPVADLAITQSDSPDPVEASERLIYTLTVGNNGPSRASAVMVTDTLPSGVTFVSASGVSWGCSNDNNFNVVTCVRTDDLLSGATSTIEVVVTAPSETTTLTNSAIVGSSITDFTMSNNSSSESTAVGSVAGLSIDLTGTPAIVDAHENVTYTVSVYNHGPSTATSVKVTDQLPNGVVFVSAQGSGWSCAYNNSIHDVICSIASLGIGLASPITIIGTSPREAATIKNLATVTAVTPDSDLVNDNVDTVEIEVRPVADLSVDISDYSDTVNANTQLLYRVRVNNAGPSTATAVELQFDLPVGTTYNSASATGWTCEVDTRGRVTCVRANFGPSSISEIEVVATAPTEKGLITASASVSSATLDKDSSNNGASEETSVTAVADLTITMNDFPKAVEANSIVTIILTATNIGPSIAESVRVVNTLSDKLEYVSATGPGWVCNYNSDNPDEVGCTLNQLAAATVSNITIQAKAPMDVTDLHNTAQISSQTNDPVSSNNTKTTGIVVDGQVDLSVTIDDTPNPVDADTIMTYTLSIVNGGPSIAYGMNLTATLPAGASYISHSGTWSCSHTNGVVTCSRASQAAEATSEVILFVTSPPNGGAATITAVVGSDTEETNPSNNSNSAVTTVQRMANLAISQRDEPDPVYAAHAMTYTLSVSNGGPSRAQNVQVIDTLPPEATFVQASGEGWNCAYDVNDHSVTCTRAKDLLEGSATEILIMLTAPTRGGFLDNTVRVSSAAQDVDLSDNSDTEGTNVTPVADLSLQVSDVPDPVYAGQTLYYNLAIDNAGPSVADLVTVTHQLPPEVLFSQITADDWNCTYDQFDHLVTCFMANLGLGMAEDIDVVVTAPTHDLVISSTTSIKASTIDLQMSNNQAQEDTIITSGADLSIRGTSHPTPVEAGTPVTYYLRVDNSGPGEARGVEATVILHEQVIFNACPEAVCSHNNGIITYPLPDMQVGHTEYLSLTLTPRSDEGVMVMASVSSVVPEMNQQDNETEMAINFEHIYIPFISNPTVYGVDLSLKIKESTDPVRADNTLFYTLEIGNAGRHSANVVIVNATLPDEATFISAAGDGWTCVHEDSVVAPQQIACSRPQLETGTSSDIMLALMPPPDAGRATFSATIRSDSEDGQLEDNSATEETVVLPIADVAVTQTDSMDTVYAGDRMTYTLSVANNGPSQASQLQVIDTLPSDVTYLNAFGAGWACQYNAPNSSITCTRPNTLAAGTLSNIFVVINAPSEGGLIDNVVRASSTVTDPNPLNNLDTERTDITPVADLSLTVTDNPSNNVNAGGSVRYSIQVHNGGPSTANAVSMRYDLPSNVSFDQVAAKGWSCNEDSINRRLTCSRASLSVGQAPPINVVVRASERGSLITSLFTVEASTLDLLPSNNSAVEETRVNQ